MNIETVLNPGSLIKDLVSDPYLIQFLGIGVKNEELRELKEENIFLSEQVREAEK